MKKGLFCSILCLSISIFGAVTAYADEPVVITGGPASMGFTLQTAGVVTEPYDPQSFYAVAKGHEQDPERGERCRRCYELRLRKTAEFMLQKNREMEEPYRYFTTTLSISPLKDAAVLNEIGERVAAEYGLSYLPSDFKKKEGYRRSTQLSREYGLYRQDYCGCVFSRRDAEKRNMR